MILIIGGKYQGKHDFAAEHFPDKSVTEFNNVLKADGGIQSYIEKSRDDETLLAAVVIADENSSGIVPDELSQIHYREEYNRSLTLLAEKADEIYRVFCGIGMKIK